MLSDFSQQTPGHIVFRFAERPVPLRMMISSAGYSIEAKPGYDWHGLRRGPKEFVLFQYTLAGEGRLETAGREYRVKPNEAMLLHFPGPNRYWLPAGVTRWEFIYVCMHGREVMRLWPYIESAIGPIASLGDKSPILRCALRLVTAALRGEIRTPYEASAGAYSLMMDLAAQVRGSQRDQHRQMVAATTAFAESRLQLPLGVGDLALQAGLSRFHFTRVFTKAAGLAPGAWLIDLRIREAARLLRTTTLPIKQIALKCGSTDASHFGKQFRQTMGMSPGVYRRTM